MDRKPIFDTVRRLLGRGFRANEIIALDRAVDRSSSAGQADPGPVSPRTIGSAGRALICAWEGCAKLAPDGTYVAYPDPGTGGAPWTIGWGVTGVGIADGTRWTRAQCDARLDADLLRYAAQVARALGGASTTQAQFDALVSFHYNTGAIARATLTRLHIAGDHAGAAREFARWNRAGGRVLAGLTRRRAAEAVLYAS